MGKDKKFLKVISNIFTRNVGFKLLAIGMSLLIFVAVHICL